MEIRRDGAAMTLYDAVGGTDFFAELVNRFYEGVVEDSRLRPMYPDDLTESRRSLRDFLVQYWGGPTDYSEVRGHPRLGRRHRLFEIDEAARDAWMEHMARAVAEMAPEPAIATALINYFEMAATHLVNARSQDHRGRNL